MAQRKKRTRDAESAADVALLQSVAARPRPGRRRADRTLAILSRKRSLYSTSRLVQAARTRGHRALVLDTLRCNLVLEPARARMIFRGVEVRGIDVVIPQIGASITAYGLAVVNQFGMMGVPVLNTSA
ncbi:MAG TPA: 30S ribosomal protein S6--L-glutamate ligase, partial [Myxococcaceae bacterium]|nr:30S ribosomal protein S6--L-glutamate ligase [Myxococcaceae bacterium]